MEEAHLHQQDEDSSSRLKTETRDNEIYNDEDDDYNDQLEFFTARGEVNEADETSGVHQTPLADAVKNRTTDPLRDLAKGPISVMHHSTPEESPPAASSPTTVQEKVFAKLLQEEYNQSCFDCGKYCLVIRSHCVALGWENPSHVSINHGIFLCANCATGIHIEHYPVEISFIKAINTDEFNYLQLRVMIKGGNKAAFDFFEVYDLQNEPVQKRYNTVAAQFYRDRMKGVLESGSMLPSAVNKIPSFEEGRQPIKSE